MTILSKRPTFLVAALFALVAWCGPAFSQDRIQALMDEGDRLSAQEDWAGAARAYDEVREYMDRPLPSDFYVKLAIASHNAGDADLATHAAEQYHMGSSSTGRNYARIEQILAEIERKDRDAYNKQEEDLSDTLRRVRSWSPELLGKYSLVVSGIGKRYLFGRGTPVDCEAAATWFGVAVTHGDAYAAETLGEMYRMGIGVERDFRKAIQWYERAIELSNRSYRAMNNLGVMHYLGLGTPASAPNARAYFSNAEWHDLPRANLALPKGTTPKWFDDDYAAAHTC